MTPTSTTHGPLRLSSLVTCPGVGSSSSLPGGGGALPLFQEFPYQNPDGDKHLEAKPQNGQTAGSDFETARAQLTSGRDLRAAIVGFDEGMFLPTLPNPRLALALARAANDWTLERWLTPKDSPFHGLLLAPNHLPDEAAAEIRRVGAHSRIVGVLMSGNGLGKRFGHPLYWPIYKAAADLNLTVVIHAGGDASPDTLTQATAGGVAMTYGEYAALAPTPLMSHLVSLIAQGVFEELPGLKVLIVGAGTLWLSGLLWRFDMEWQALRRDVRWLTRPPSEYVRSNVRIATYPLERAPTPAQLARALATFPAADELFCFASGYPWSNDDTVDEVARRLPPSWLTKVLFENALAWFRWSSDVSSKTAVANAR